MTDSSPLFLAWNDGIARHFFKPEMASRPVTLFVNETVLEEVARDVNADPANFAEVVKAGPTWLNGSAETICRDALSTMRGWRERDLTFPPYIAYLALFVYAAGITGDFAKHAYYPRLRTVLGLPLGSTLPGFDRMLELWDDLERWSVVDTHGALGLFEARITGKWIHVGVPLAQAVLTAEERKLLPAIFARASLDPEALPTNDELAQNLRKFGSDVLRHKTLAVLQNEKDEMYTVLLDTVVEELMAWDGNVDEPTADVETGTYSSIKIFLEIEPLSGHCESYLRATLPAWLEKCALDRIAGELPQHIYCEEDIPGWSMPLSEEQAGVIIDAGALDWSQPQRLTCLADRVQFRSSVRPVRVFVEALAQGLSGFMESQALPGAAPFLVAFHSAHRDRILCWLNEECTQAKAIATKKGVPTGWELWSVQKANGDATVRRQYPWLRLPDSIRLRFRGGVRSSAGNYYFAFAPPSVEVIGYTGNEELLANGVAIQLSEQGIAALDVKGPGQHLQLEVKAGDDVISRRSLFFVTSLNFDELGRAAEFSQWGDFLSEDGAAAISGALTKVSHVGMYRFRYPFEYNDHRPERVHLLGLNPGEIVVWPQEPLPDPRSAVWAVAEMGARAEASYIRAESASDDSTDKPARERVRMWKEILWYRRRRVTPPRFVGQRREWRRLQAAAEHVNTR